MAATTYDIYGTNYVGWSGKLYDKDGNVLYNYDLKIPYVTSSSATAAELAEIMYQVWQPIVMTENGVPQFQGARLSLFANPVYIDIGKFPVYLKKDGSSVLYRMSSLSGTSPAEYAGNYGMGVTMNYGGSWNPESVQLSYGYCSLNLDGTVTYPFYIPYLTLSSSFEPGETELTLANMTAAGTVAMPVGIDEEVPPSIGGTVYSNQWRGYLATQFSMLTCHENSRSPKIIRKYPFAIYDGDASTGTKYGESYFTVTEIPFRPFVPNVISFAVFRSIYNTPYASSYAMITNPWLSKWLRYMHTTTNLSSKAWKKLSINNLGLNVTYDFECPSYTAYSTTATIASTLYDETANPNRYNPKIMDVNTVTSTNGGTISRYNGSAYASASLGNYNYILMPYTGSSSYKPITWSGQLIWYDETAGAYDETSIVDYGFRYNPSGTEYPMMSLSAYWLTDRDGYFSKTLKSGGLLYGWNYEDYGPSQTDPYEKQDKSTTAGGDGNYDKESDAINTDTYSSTMGTGNGGFLTIYLPDEDNMESLKSYLFTNNTSGDTLLYAVKGIVDTIGSLGRDPVDYIVKSYEIPVDLMYDDTKDFQLGWYKSQITLPTLKESLYVRDMGEINIEPYWGNALDYQTDVQIYLPYIGYQQLNPREVMGKTLHLVYNIDLITANCVAQIYVDGSILYQFSGTIGYDIPIGSDNAGNDILKGVQTAVSAVAAVI